MFTELKATNCKVSIITVVLNNSIGLRSTLQSISRQVFKNYEHIIIDGGSSDDTIEVIREYIDNISYWISEKDSGIYNAMNKGIKVSTGQYLLFLNSGDTLINEDTLDTINKSLGNYDIIFGNLRISNSNEYKEVIFPDYITFNYLRKNYLPHPSAFIKRDLFKLVGYYDENLKICSDWCFFLLSIAKFNCSYKHLNVVVTDFNSYGISSGEMYSNVISTEKKNFLEREFSAFVKDFEVYDSMNLLKYKIIIKLLIRLGLIKKTYFE